MRLCKICKSKECDNLNIHSYILFRKQGFSGSNLLIRGFGIRGAFSRTYPSKKRGSSAVQKRERWFEKGLKITHFCVYLLLRLTHAVRPQEVHGDMSWHADT